jgi:hypothetical protein
LAAIIILLAVGEGDHGRKEGKWRRPVELVRYSELSWISWVCHNLLIVDWVCLI